MSGHSKWAQIKRKKEKTDQKRGQVFTRLIREITIAARQGGGDPEKNPRLRTAIVNAKSANMPQSNIEKAIKRGTGELPGVHYEEVLYEGYGPSGVAILIEATTDNKNRTTSAVRHIFTRRGGNLGSSGCVSWMFHIKGLIQIQRDNIDEDAVMDIALNSGAEDVQDQGDVYEIITAPDDVENVKKAFEDKGIKVLNVETTKIPQTNVHIEGNAALKLLKLLEELEDLEDVKSVYSNFDIPDSLMTEVSEG